MAHPRTVFLDTPTKMGLNHPTNPPLAPTPLGGSHIVPPAEHTILTLGVFSVVMALIVLIPKLL